MSLKPSRQGIVVLGTLSLLLLPRAARAQDLASIFTTLGRFVSGFDAGVVYFAPAGFLRSAVLEERGELQQIGLELRNPKIGINVGFDVLNGFRAEEESLDLRGSVTSLPTISTFYETQLSSTAKPVLPSTTLSLGVGLSQLQDARATLPLTTGERIVKLGGSGYHVGAGLSFDVSFGDVGLFLENSLRYTRFPSLDWTEDKSVVPPAGWPTSMDFWTGTLRIGVMLGARSDER